MGARARPTVRRRGLVECRHLELDGLAVERLTGGLACPLEWLPLFATDVLTLAADLSRPLPCSPRSYKLSGAMGEREGVLRDPPAAYRPVP